MYGIAIIAVMTTATDRESSYITQIMNNAKFLIKLFTSYDTYSYIFNKCKGKKIIQVVNIFGKSIQDATFE